MNLLDKIYAKIKWLRTQPESVKTRYVWVSALVVVAVIALLWVGVFRKYERKPANNEKNPELIEAGEKLKNEIEDTLKNIKMPENIMPSVSPSSQPVVSPEVSPELTPKSLK